MADQNASKLGIASTTLKASASLPVVQPHPRVPTNSYAVLVASARLWISPFKGSTGAHNYFKDVMFSMMRVQLGNLDTAQERYMNGTTTPVYNKWCQDNGIVPESITLASGTQAHWLGSSTAKQVILWFHGMSHADTACLIW
jgi:hypothetical protein